MKKPIFILEGPDKSGKTYLSKQLLSLDSNNCYIHNSNYKDKMGLFLDTIKSAEIISNTHLVVIDRLHFSDYVYGNLFYQKPDIETFDFDENFILPKNFIKILCLPPKDICVKLHSENLEKEDYSTNEEVWDSYEQLFDSGKMKGWIKYNWMEKTFDNLYSEIKSLYCSVYSDWFSLRK